MPPRETSAHRNRARQIAHVIAESGANIEQQEVAFPANLIVLIVVENVVVCAAGDDWRIGELTFGPDELVREFCFDFGFVDARLEEFANAFETFSGEIASSLYGGDFRFGFHNAQAVHDARETFVTMKRKLSLAFAHESGIATFYFNAGALVFVAVEVNDISFAGDLTKERREIGKPFDIFDAGNSGGLFSGEFVAFPGRKMFIGFADEQNFAMIRIKRLRCDQQYGFFLMNAGEIKEVSVLNMAHRAVRVGGHNVVGVENGDGIREQRIDEALAIVNEQLSRQRNGFHVSNG